MKNIRLQLMTERLLTGSFKIQIIALIVFTALIIFFGSILVFSFWEYGFAEAIWWSFLRITDPGNLALDTATSVRFIGSIVAILGWVIFGLLISIISTSIQLRLEELQKGRSAVHYKNHAIVFGWNQTIFSILDELTASQNIKDAPVVVMSNKKTEDMYSEIKSFCRPSTVNNIICRNGNPESMEDQIRVNIAQADIVIVLNNHLEVGSFNSDAAALKTLLAYSNKDHKVLTDELSKVTKSSTNVIVEISRPEYLDFIKGIIPSDISDINNQKINLLPVITTKVLGKILAVCAMQPGLSRVYQELFSYHYYDESNKGKTSEIYFHRLFECGVNEEVVFEDLFFGFEKAILIGYMKDGKTPVINPPVGSEKATATIDPHKDYIIYVADDHDIVKYVRPAYIPKLETIPAQKNDSLFAQNKVLVLGNGFKAETVIKELFGFLTAGSEITCSKSLESQLDFTLATKDLKMHYREMEKIDTILFDLIGGRDYDFDLIIFADEVKDPYNYDSRSLMCLAGINAVAKSKNRKPRVVMELFDPKNAELAQTAHADDVIIGSELVSNYLVQVARTPEREFVYSELLTAGGSEIYFKPVKLYKANDNPISFSELRIAARHRNEIAIGYTYGDDVQFAYIINPSPDDRKVKRDNFKNLIVLAEDAS